MNAGVKRVGITGGIGSGKSAVTDLLQGKGYVVIDADETAREAAAPGEPAMLRLSEEIGDGFFLEDGSLDRQGLAKIMFNDPIVLMAVNEIFHHDIHRRIEKKTMECAERGEELVFISAPLLFESGGDWMTDEIWLVTADEDIRLRRVMQRNDMSEEDVRARMRNQMPEEEKRKRVDLVIENNGTLEELKDAIEGILEKRV